MIVWLRKHPVAFLVALQALLCIWNLNLLSPWGDEVVSLRVARLDVAALVHAAASDIHPPLYYFLLHVWQGLPLGLDPVVQARLLSVLFLLVATVAVDLFWARRLPEHGRTAFLVIWTLSPSLLLYSRMCRSYSLQVLTSMLAAVCIWNYAETRTRKRQLMLAGTLAAALYTHYVPGIALLATANLMLIRKRRLGEAAQIDALVGLACLPWMGWLWQSISRWGHLAEGYSVTGTSAWELPVKLGYWLMSITIGESQPDASLAAGIVIVPMVLWLVAMGLRRNPGLAWIALPCTIIGFIGVARWVSYPFLPARMLFLYPLLLLLAVEGGMVWKRTGRVAWIAIGVLSVVGMGCYFTRTDFRNKEYPMPVREIAAYIEQHSAASDSAIVVDSTNSDRGALDYALAGSRSGLPTGDPETTRAIGRMLDDPRIRCIWFLRNTHDISIQKLDEQFERQIGAAMKATVHPYERFSPLERRGMRVVGIDPPPEWFHELIEFRR